MQYRTLSLRLDHPKTAAACTRPLPTPRDFADFCCELVSGLGSMQVKHMFGGWGLSVDGLTIAILADLGDGDTLWLKADADSRADSEAEGCHRQGRHPKTSGQEGHSWQTHSGLIAFHGRQNPPAPGHQHASEGRNTGRQTDKHRPKSARQSTGAHVRSGQRIAPR